MEREGQVINRKGAVCVVDKLDPENRAHHRPTRTTLVLSNPDDGSADLFVGEREIIKCCTATG